MDLREVDAALQAEVDREVLPGVSYAVLRDGEVVARRCIGWADREAKVPLTEAHLFRAFSNTKLVTSVAALQLLEQKRFSLDDPVGDYIPALKNLRMLPPGATSVADTQPAREPVRIRHVLTHTAGFTYAFTKPDAPLAKAYVAAGMTDPQRDLEREMEALGTLPLLFEPGSAWNYSVATDVVGRLVEVLSGEKLDAYFQRHIFAPLGMQDTFFFVPDAKADRLVPQYIGNLKDPSQPGLRRADHLPFEGAFRKPVPLLNPGGGLVTSLGDYTSFVRALLRGGAPLLQPETMPLVTQNQLPPGMWIGDPRITGRGHSFAASVTVEESSDDPAGRVGDVLWGGLAATKWLFSPRQRMGMVLMTQRYFGHDLPFWTTFRSNVRRALAAG